MWSILAPCDMYKAAQLECALLTWKGHMAQQRGIEPIVLVEDDPNDVFFVRRALQNAHITNPLMVFETVEQARQGVGGFQMHVHNPVLLILDLYLPGGESGLDFLRWLRKQA